jgi:ketosteroid isomerase-like protein
MATVDDLDQVLEQFQLALGEFMKGNPEPAKKLWSHLEDVTLLNPIGALAHGWEQVGATMERVASQLSCGEIASFETVEKYLTPELAYVVWVERSRAKVGARQDIAPFDLRVTIILRPEEGTWKVVHRHADSITTARPIESMVQGQPSETPGLPPNER